MKGKYVKEFFIFPDVLVMSFLFFISFGWMIYTFSIITLLAFLLGMVGYTLNEYLTHRFIFHMKPPKNRFLLKFMKRIHYDHHSTPNDLHLLFLPLWYSLPAIAITAVIVYLFTWSFAITNAFSAGVMLFLLFYEWKHYVAHRPIQPVSPWGKWMKKVHLWHHYKNENYWYGVTNPAYDFLLGTFKDQKDVESSETAKNLEKRGEHNMKL
ncbi:sterol desaturase family protein [Alkalihalobacterium chitinilyticum]|uniref:Sterol desaturase family protein n=1 Tax=Alkalihalobacterium chitinilyticum TaxID=2980103 RepID=A0ABT5VH57_9BACI|nr:sterol desaturase family protein [Alkalihalobacterium chitinilyticum]MDE5414785.1 sterol desaturase family protein [Alkalihalobacterium chitinilyticum]